VAGMPVKYSLWCQSQCDKSINSTRRGVVSVTGILVRRLGGYRSRATGKAARSGAFTLSRIFCVIAAGFVALTESQPIRAQASSSETIKFDIPSQALESALDAYSVATGLEVFYNAALAERRRSTALVGAFTSSAALQLLLTGTGYAPRATGQGAFTIVALRVETSLASGRAAMRNARYEGYFSALQRRISDVLCTLPDSFRGGQDVVVKMWFETAGKISRVEVLDAAGMPDRGFVRAMQQLKIEAPPAGMPQPVTLVIFPPSAKATECGMIGSAGSERVPQSAWRGLVP
jgi:hypothetical protein